MATTHPLLRVRVAPHEADDPAWRIRHAGETIAIVLAYFETDQNGSPVQADDGTFAVHATSRTTLDTLRQMLTDHEGLTIVTEEQAPGNGIIVAREHGE
ncbi:hypothetical protein ACGFJT_37380 [Actinomadura geliboluensis]|uniref:hypothetical protein n=1 Tax=Actinomadura geliboluensis TaxID=882440 RepID=UPI00371FCE52